jgi:hypothetical protein
VARFYETIICISDLQEPFGHPDAYKFLHSIKRKYYINRKKTKVVNQGDEADFHNFSKYPKDPNGYGPMEEYNRLLQRLSLLWSLFPEQDICISNHTIRPLKVAYQAGLPQVFLREYHEFLNAPKDCKWQDSWVHNDIMFEHGENVSGMNAALRAAKSNRQSTSIGHQHSHGGVQYSTCRKDTIFGLNTGCLIDVDAYAMAYGKNIREKPTLGLGVIVDNVPHFIPMKLNAKKRWTGKL